jgi:hypothetical protein
MSKQHQASRRRTYGRRQHELHERAERPVGFLGWLEGRQSAETGDRSGLDRLNRAGAGDRLVARGID